MNVVMPTLFVSHGAPTLALETGPTAEFLKQLGSLIPRPKAILCVSAHWESLRPQLTASAIPETIHDFYGFPEELYRMTYPASGDPELAEEIIKLLRGAAFEASANLQRGLDHGAWVPLALMYPAADIPVIQLSVQTHLGAGHHLNLGKALQSLREKEVLILGSGGATHNLRELGFYHKDSAPIVSAVEFDRWLETAISRGDEAALLNYRELAPSATRNHPSAEHYLPLLVALGAGGTDKAGKRIHEGFIYGMLSMAAYAWGWGDL